MSVEQTNIPKRKDAYDLSTFRVLIVEDFTFIADLMASALSEIGVGEVMVAHSGNLGKEKILSFNAVQSMKNMDVVILDWLMPDGSGEETLKWMRNHKSDTIRFLPVIVCSAYTSRDIVEKTRDFGANEVMVKPISADKLAKRILHVIDNPRPYIKTPDFFGPDRRRKVEKISGPERRTTKPDELVSHHETLE